MAPLLEKVCLLNHVGAAEHYRYGHDGFKGTMIEEAYPVSQAGTNVAVAACAPGCAKLETKPLPTESETSVKTIGMVFVFARRHVRGHQSDRGNRAARGKQGSIRQRPLLAGDHSRC
jgi:hypothetical protein